MQRCVTKIEGKERSSANAHTVSLFGVRVTALFERSFGGRSRCSSSHGCSGSGASCSWSTSCRVCALPRDANRVKTNRKQRQRTCVDSSQFVFVCLHSIEQLLDSCRLHSIPKQLSHSDAKKRERTNFFSFSAKIALFVASSSEYFLSESSLSLMISRCLVTSAFLARRSFWILRIDAKPCSRKETRFALQHAKPLARLHLQAE